MADRMIFPKNPMDFIKEHTEFANGVWVMPTWRVEQLVAHYIHERNKAIVERLESLKEDYYLRFENDAFSLEEKSRFASRRIGVREAINIFREGSEQK